MLLLLSLKKRDTVQSVKKFNLFSNQIKEIAANLNELKRQPVNKNGQVLPWYIGHLDEYQQRFPVQLKLEYNQDMFLQKIRKNCTISF